MKYKWNYQPPTPVQREAAKTLSRELGISPILCRLLQERGISTADEAKRFFRPQLGELHDPFLMKDMDKAVERLNRAMGRKERILVYGDYDVDGTTAVSTFPTAMRRATGCRKKESTMRMRRESDW